MKILSEQNTLQVLLDIDKSQLLDVYQPELLRSLATLNQDPTIIPPRVVEPSHTPTSDATHLFMPCVGDAQVGLKVITGGPSNSRAGKGFVGCILVLDEHDGALLGVVNARVITAFRTALASSIPLVHIMNSNHGLKVLDTITVLGSGLQAFWHVKLALILYGDRFFNVNIVNRSIQGAEKLKTDLSDNFPNVKFLAYLYEEKSHQESIQNSLQSSSVIFGCLPTTEPIIKSINKDPSVLKYINLIGSYKPHMLELDPEIVNSFQDTLIMVDAKEHALHEAGELIQAGKTPEDCVEICELGEVSVDKLVTKNGVVLLKLVGVAIMDICVGKLVLERAGSLGVEIGDF